MNPVKLGGIFWAGSLGWLLGCLPGQAAAQAYLDAALSHEIQSRIHQDPVLANQSIEVETSAGIVTLRGRVPSMAVWGRIGLLAENVPGVALLINDLALDPEPRRSDPQIERTVREAMAGVAGIAPGQIRVDVDDGVTTIRGAVDSWPQHDRLLRAIRAVSGVALIRDQLHVQSAAESAWVPPRPPEEIHAGDGQIFAVLHAMLASDPYLGGGRVKASVIDGVVYLFGAVPSRQDRSHAEAMVALVPGVLSVQNQLAVRSSRAP